MNPDIDFYNIIALLRRHIEIRNRSWMKNIYRDCFIGSEAIDFLVSQGIQIIIIYICNYYLFIIDSITKINI